MKQRTQALYEAIGNIDPKWIREVSQMKQPEKRKHRLLPAMIAALLSVFVLATAATVLIYRGSLNDPLVTENQKYKEAPEGYVAITTAEELNAIRQNLGGKYILMEDISLSGWEWVPIGTADAPFSGVFNGNGHEISGMTVRQDTGIDSPAFVGLFGSAPSALILNLSMRDASLEVANAWDAQVGVIAGSVGYLMSSQTVNCRITLGVNVNVMHVDETKLQDSRDTVSAEEFQRIHVNHYVGGLAGKATTVDSCLSDTDVVIDGYVSEYVRNWISKDAPAPWRYVYHYAGKISGLAYSVITSYAEGTLTDKTGTFRLGLVGHECLTPAVLPSSLYHTVISQLTEKYMEGIDAENPQHPQYLSAEWIVKKWSAEYTEHDEQKLHRQLEEDRYTFAPENFRDTVSHISEGRQTTRYYSPRLIMWKDRDALQEITGIGTLMQPLFYGEYEPETEYYVMDLFGGIIGDRINADNVLADVYDRDELRALWDSYNLRVGNIDCYDLTETPDTDFEGFDFQHVWEMKDGRPTLRIFTK